MFFYPNKHLISIWKLYAQLDSKCINYCESPKCWTCFLTFAPKMPTIGLICRHFRFIPNHLVINILR